VVPDDRRCTLQAEGEREVSEGCGLGDAPRKGRRATVPGKSRWLMGPQCPGDVLGGWPGNAAHGSGGSGVDERGRGEMGMRQRLTFIFNEISSVARAKRGKKGGRRGAFAWRREKEERGGPLSRRSVAWGGRQWPRPVGAGGAVAERTEEGGGRGRRGDAGEHS
jgi:hypothetical protein